MAFNLALEAHQKLTDLFRNCTSIFGNVVINLSNNRRINRGRWWANSNQWIIESSESIWEDYDSIESGRGGKMRSGPPEMELLWYGGFRWSKMFTFAVDNEHVCVSPVVVKQNRLSVTFGADVRIHLAGCCNIYLTIPGRNSIPTDVFTVRAQTKQWGWWFLPIFIFINIFKVLLSQSRRFPGTTCSIIFIWEWLSHHNCNWIRGLIKGEPLRKLCQIATAIAERIEHWTLHPGKFMLMSRASARCDAKLICIRPFC